MGDFFIKTASYRDILKAQERIGDIVFKTSLEYSRSASQWVGTPVYLKFENQQLTGSFKIRGALNKVLFFCDEMKGNLRKVKGFVAASAGNHAQGVAYAARKVHQPSYVVMPKMSPLVKIKATKGYGAKVILKGDSFDEAYQYARNLERKKNYTFIHPFEDPHVIAGQGTVGLEIVNAIQDLDSIVVPIGGGGLISGIALVLKRINPRCKVFGVVLESYPGMRDLYVQSGKPQKPNPVSFLKSGMKKGKQKGEALRGSVKKKQSDFLNTKQLTIADGVAVKNPSLWMYKQYISRFVDDIVAVNEEIISEAVIFLMERAKTVVEASGAMGLAAAVQGKLRLGKKTCILLSGGNIDLNLISKVIEKGLIKLGRIAHLAVVVKDQPGILELLLSVIAKEQVNVLEVRHERGQAHLNLDEVKIYFLLNTFDFKQIEKIKKELKNKGILIL